MYNSYNFMKIVKNYITTGYENTPRNFKTLKNKDFSSLVVAPTTIFALAKITFLELPLFKLFNFMKHKY